MANQKIVALKGKLVEARKKVSEAKATLLKEPTKEDLQAALNDAMTEVDKLQDELAATAEAIEPTEDQLSKVRKEEKTKLYDKMKELQDANKALADKMQALANNSNPEAPEKAAEKPETKTEAKVEDKKSDNSADIDPRLVEIEKRNAILQTQLAEMQKSLEIKELEAYKSSQLAKAGSDIVVELVSGSTKEEIDNSIKKAQEVFQSLKKKIGAPGAAGGSNSQGSLPTTPSPRVDVNAIQGKFTPDQIRRMDPKDWAAKRKEFGFR